MFDIQDDGLYYLVLASKRLDRFWWNLELLFDMTMDHVTDSGRMAPKKNGHYFLFSLSIYNNDSALVLVD